MPLPVVGLLLPYEKKGITFDTAFHRPTVRYMDLLNGQLEILIKIYSSKTWCLSNPNDFFDNEAIVVHVSDIVTHFVPLADGSSELTIQETVIGFLQTIDPAEEGSKYPSCRFDYKNDATVI